MKLNSGFIHIFLIGLIVLIAIVFFAPIPYKIDEDPKCLIAESCPKNGWGLEPSLYSKLNLKFKTKSEPLQDTNKANDLEWKLYELKKLGVDFSLPSVLTSEEFFESETTKNDAGKAICFTHEQKAGASCSSYFEDFVISAVSDDYACGCGSSFLMNNGYVYEENAFWSSYIKDGSENIKYDENAVSEITNLNGVKILKIKHVNLGLVHQSTYPSPEHIGAVINIDQENYSSLAIEMKLDAKRGLTEDLFDQILSTFRFLPNTSDWKTYIDNQNTYRIKYPKNFILNQNKTTSVDGVVIPSENTTQLISPVVNGSNFSIKITDKTNDVNLLLNALAGQPSTCSEIKSSEGNIYILNGLTSLIFKDTLCGPSGATIIYIKNRSFLYEIEINSQLKFDMISQSVMAILSSLEFIDTEDRNDGEFCGGIAANLPQNQCPEGYNCKLNGNYPDASGKCVKK